MINQRKAVVRKRPSPPSAPRQLSIAFDPQVLHGMTPFERSRAVTHLASLLIQAAGVVIEERDNDRI